MTTTVYESPETLADLRAEVRPLVTDWRRAGRVTPRPDAWLRGYDREFTRALSDAGWIGITWPQDLGGGGRSNLARLVIIEEFPERVWQRRLGRRAVSLGPKALSDLLTANPEETS